MNVLKAKLTKRYLWIVLIVVLFALSSIYVIASHVMNNSVRSQIDHRDELNAKTLSYYVESKMRSIMSDMRIASSYVLGRNKEVYRSEMERMVSDDALYLFIQAYDRDGNVLIRVPNIDFPAPVRFEKIQRRLSWSKTVYVSNLITLPGGRKTVAIAYPSLDESGRYQGGVIAFLNLHALSDYLRKFTIGTEGMNMILDRNGTIIAHSNETYIGRSLSGRYVGNALQKDRFGLWQGKLFGSEMVVAYRPFLLGKLGLIVGETIEQAMAPARSVQSLLFKAFIVVFIIAMILTIFGISRVVRPVLSLMKQVNEYKEDKRNRFDHVKTKDELEDLSTVLEQMAQALTEKERKLFYILESIPYAVITTDQEGTIVTFNSGAERLTLYRRNEVIGRSIFDFSFKPEKEEFVLLKTLMEGKAVEEAESYIFDKNGQKHDVRIYSSLFKRESHERIGSILVIRDVGELKRMEEHLKQSERLASLGQLTAGIAHEVKNPLSIIRAAAEAIDFEFQDEDTDTELVRELTSDILESSDRMDGLLQDFLQLTKGDSNDQTEQIDIVAVLDDLLQLLKQKIESFEITVIRRYQVEEAFVYGNKNRLTQVFLNIVLNSFQAMEYRGTLTVSIKDHDPDWQIEITDTGEGIPESKIKWIFNPFFSTKPEGTGLGLSIAHEIIMQHQGGISAKGEKDGGTTISIKLPKMDEEGRSH